MGERLAAGNAAIALLANSLATGCGLAVLILVFAGVSGAHFNPVVTLSAAMQPSFPWREVLPYILAQVAGAYGGVALAHFMFEEALFSAGTKARTGAGQWVSEAVATFGLVMVIRACSRDRPAAIPYAVAAYITAAYWFTASTSFANPAVTLARAATDTFAGIRPADAPAFIAAQLAGTVLALGVGAWLFGARSRS